MINGVITRSLRISGLFFLLLALAACTTTANQSTDTTEQPAPADPVHPAYDVFPADVRLTCPEPEPIPACPPPPTVKCPVCPAPAPAGNVLLDGKLLVGGLEMVKITPPGYSYRARIDSGATSSSIHASNIIRFERDGERWVRFDLESPTGGEATTLERKVQRRVRVRQAGQDDIERRVVVLMSVSLGPITQQLDMSLTDRSDMEFPVLIGRDLLRNTAIVDVSQQMIAK